MRNATPTHTLLAMLPAPRVTLSEADAEAAAKLIAARQKIAQLLRTARHNLRHPRATAAQRAQAAEYLRNYASVKAAGHMPELHSNPTRAAHMARRAETQEGVVHALDNRPNKAVPLDSGMAAVLAFTAEQAALMRRLEAAAPL